MSKFITEKEVIAVLEDMFLDGATDIDIDGNKYQAVVSAYWDFINANRETSIQALTKGVNEILTNNEV